MEKKNEKEEVEKKNEKEEVELGRKQENEKDEEKTPD